MNIKEQIENEIAKNSVVVYMKGTDVFPQCGFSSKVVNIVKRFNLKAKYINVLEDQKIREGIKEFSLWPTIPQIYIKGEFIGGCDILTEMNQNGELEKLLKEKELI